MPEKDQPTQAQGHQPRERLKALVERRRKELGKSRAKLSEELGHGGDGDGGKTLGRWYSGKSAPSPQSIRQLARILQINQIELHIELGWLDSDVLNVALRTSDTYQALADGLHAYETTLNFLPVGGGALANQAARSGRWDAVLLPDIQVLGPDASSPIIHFKDFVGLRSIPTSTPTETRNHVLDTFASVIRQTGAMPEDDHACVAELNERVPGFSLWMRVPRLLAERPPLATAFDARTIRSIAVIGGHFCGHDDIAALFAQALDWGYVNTSFASMALFGRDISNQPATRLRAQDEHDRNAALVARTLDAMTAVADRRVWAHGSPGSITDVAAAVADHRPDQLVIFLPPNEALNLRAEQITAGRPDAVDANIMRVRYAEATEILSQRDSVVTLPIDERACSDEGLRYLVANFRELYLEHRYPDLRPVEAIRDDNVRAILQAS